MLTTEQTRRLEEARQRQRNQQIENARIARASFMTWLREVFTNTARAIDPRKLAGKYLRDYRNRRKRRTTCECAPKPQNPPRLLKTLVNVQ